MPEQTSTRTPTIPYPGAFDIGDFSERMTLSMDMLSQLMSGLGAIDQFQNMLAARSDPTIPALINSQLGNYVRFQNQSGNSANDFLSGNYSGAGPALQPMSMGGDPNDPFSIPIQRPGGNAMTEQIFNQLIGPVGLDQLAQYAQGVFGMYSPIPALRPQTNRPLPNVVAPNFDDILSQFGFGPTQTGGGMPPAPAMPQSPTPTQPQPTIQRPGLPQGNVTTIGGNQVGAMPMMQQGPTPITQLPMPSFQQGTPYVPQTGPAMLHQGEAVVPAQQNPFVQQPNAAPPGVTPKPPPMAQQEVFGGANTSMPAPAPRPQPMAPNPMLQTSQPFDIHTGQPVTLPGDPGVVAAPQPSGVSMPPPGTPQQGPQNPLQMALGSLMMQLGGGGPINQNVQNIQQQQLADLVSRGQQQQLENMRANFGARGLGGSGLQFGMERDIGNNALSALTQGMNQIGLDAAGRNYDALGQTAQQLIGGSLGAGQFGLQQQQQQQAMSMSMFDQLLQAIRNTFANPAQQAANTTNVSFV